MLARTNPFLALSASLLVLPLTTIGCSDDDGGTPVADAARPDAAALDAAPTDAAPADAMPPPGLRFAAPGSSSAPSGAGSFRFGVASSSAQIEDRNESTDWYLWTAPGPDGLARSPFVGEAVKGYTLALEDVALLADMNLDSYRFSIEWARIEPQRDVIDEDALAHYDRLIDALLAHGIRPMITLHHFSSPVWVDDPRDAACASGPTDANLCGLDHPEGGPLVVHEIAEHARLLAARYGDRVDDWGTLNEPMIYLLRAYGTGAFPPGKIGFLTDFEGSFMAAVRTYLSMHAAMYHAIKEADTIDADGDGVAASVGLAQGAQEYVPVRDGRISDHPDDLAAGERLRWFFEYAFVEALIQGAFDSNMDGTLDEPHPEWAGTLDWLGVQYYARAGVSAEPTFPVLDLTLCVDSACLPPLDPTYEVPAMGYYTNPNGIYTMLTDFAARWPGLPLMVTESGIASEVGARRAELLVRALESVHRAIQEGVDVRGYYHWSVMDNFEWSLGTGPRFGLYRVDFDTFARTPTEAATVYGEIAGTRSIAAPVQARYGGTGPMTPEE